MNLTVQQHAYIMIVHTKEPKSYSSYYIMSRIHMLFNRIDAEPC